MCTSSWLNLSPFSRQTSNAMEDEKNFSLSYINIQEEASAGNSLFYTSYGASSANVDGYYSGSQISAVPDVVKVTPFSDIVKQEDDEVADDEKKDEKFGILWKDPSVVNALKILMDKTKEIFQVRVIDVHLKNAAERVIRDAKTVDSGAPIVPKFLKAARKDRVVNSELSSVFDEFVHQADILVRLIVTEFTLKGQQKLIRRSDVGGVAGGQKYMSKGYLLKVARDVLIKPGHFLYSGRSNSCSEMAMKAAAQELTAANRYFEYFERLSLKHQILVPMQTMVDYLGFRVVAMPVLPVNKESIVYGSCDAGKSVKEGPEEVRNILKNAAEEFFLCAHIVRGQVLFTAGDVEVHQHSMSGDGYFILDLARSFPPEFFSVDSGVLSDVSSSCDSLAGRTKTSGQAFFRLLRPEFLRAVKENPVPLIKGFPPILCHVGEPWIHIHKRVRSR
eukprot:TRINITY_DN12252_c0_g1_i11.p1 TRINITY_DN12252_c0_g1~~TRINITY_DN12252_c0_g1_i11.p1  ORF type:complete len:447 (-),score=83.80 TRINITY_DN12252_c0_g1_i11:961-2301(-)